MKVGELLRWGSEALHPPRPGLPDPAREARWLLARALAVTEGWLWAHREEVVGAPQEALFRSWIARRRRGEPAHYLTGSCPFWGREFYVSPAVLIPRPETELLVASALALPLPPRPRILDMGTGSGCLAVTLAAHWPAARVVAVDLSPAALAVAKANARRHSTAVDFAASDLAAAVSGPFDLVVANLPYLPDAHIPLLAPEVSRFEPRLALAGGSDGSQLLRRLLADLPRLLAPHGHALLEVSPDHVATLRALAPAAGVHLTAVLSDVTGVPRGLHLRPNAGGQ